MKACRKRKHLPTVAKQEVPLVSLQSAIHSADTIRWSPTESVSIGPVVEHRIGLATLLDDKPAK